VQNPSSRSLHAASANAAGLIARDSAVLEQAAAEFAATLRPIPHAETLEDLAELLPRAGRIRALDEALAQYGRAGASADTSRIRLRLRTLGVERRSRSFSRPLIGWSSLTPAELKTVRLVALGMSNRAVAAELVVSPHTVNSHVRRSFTKLGISSRVQLARLVFAHDTAPAAPADGLAGPRGRSIEPRSPAHHHLVSRA
jgi:DNA-binding CsgD family transcriptional regulator